MPVYNGEDYIRETIESVLAQTMSDLRLVISDNASEDATQEIAQEFAARDPRIVYHRNPENLGYARNFFNSLEMCRPYRYITQIGHDDIWDPGFAEKIIRLMETKSDTSMGFCRVTYIDEHGDKMDMDWYERVTPYLPSLASENRRIRLSVIPQYLFEHGIIKGDCWDPYLLKDYHGIHPDVFMVRGLLIQGPSLVHDEALFLKRIHRKSFSAGVEYFQMYGKRNCWQATNDLRERFGLNLLETLTCWYSLFIHYKIKIFLKKQWYRFAGLPKWLRRKFGSKKQDPHKHD